MRQKKHTPAASWLLTAVVCAITAALCQAFLLPHLPPPPPVAAPCSGGGGSTWSSWSSKRGKTPSTPLVDGLDGSRYVCTSALNTRFASTPRLKSLG